MAKEDLIEAEGVVTEVLPNARFRVTLENVAPVVDAGMDMAGTVGGTLSFAGSFFDPGREDEHVLRWNFGDGTALVSGTLTPEHTYARAGDYVVVFSVEDGRARVEDSLTVVISADPDEVVPPEGDAGDHDAGSGEEQCSVGRSSPCLCDDKTVGTRHCAVSGTWSPCVCDSTNRSDGGDAGCTLAGVETASWWSHWARR